MEDCRTWRLPRRTFEPTQTTSICSGRVPESPGVSPSKWTRRSRQASRRNLNLTRNIARNRDLDRNLRNAGRVATSLAMDLEMNVADHASSAFGFLSQEEAEQIRVLSRALAIRLTRPGAHELAQKLSQERRGAVATGDSGASLLLDWVGTIIYSLAFIHVDPEEADAPAFARSTATRTPRRFDRLSDEDTVRAVAAFEPALETMMRAAQDGLLDPDIEDFVLNTLQQLELVRQRGSCNPMIIEATDRRPGIRTQRQYSRQKRLRGRVRTAGGGAGNCGRGR